MKNAFVFGVKAVLLTLAGCSLGSTGGYDESVNSATYSVSDISYAGAQAGDRLDISKMQITLTCVDASNSNQTYYCKPKEAYDHLKQKNVSFSLTITADGEKVISFGGDENFPETHNPFTFDAGATAISIAGAIGGNEVNLSSWIFVGEKTEFHCQNVSGIAYRGGAKVGDRLDLSNVEIAIGVYFWDEQGEYQEATYTYNPQKTYAFLKSQGISFSLAIAAGGEEVVSFGNTDGQFPAHSPYAFKEAGEVEISISGTIDMYEVSKSFSLKVEAKNRAENYEALLKMILGEEKYNEIKANLESSLGGDGLVLTAALIKEVGEKYPAIMTTDEHDDAVRANAAIFVAQAEKYINITKGEKRIPAVLKASSNYEEMEGWRDEYAENSVNNTVYKINEYENEISFTGSFDLREISFPENNGKGKFSEARLTYSNPIAVNNNKFYVDIEQVNKIINIKGTNETTGDSLPTLEFNDILDEVKSKEIYNLYKIYQDKGEIKKLVLHSDLSVVAMNGKEISGRTDYTLFNDKDEAKESNDPSIISLNVDALSQMNEQLKIFMVSNMIISGEAKETRTVNWELVNIVFENDVSKITHNNTRYMYGIVYFKDMPYNTKDAFYKYRYFLYGMLKLKKLTDNFYVSIGDGDYGVIDVRDIDISSINTYDKGVIKDGTVNSIYFDENHKDIKDIKKIFKADNGYVNNVYFGEKREFGIRITNYDYYNPSSKTPRALRDFEFLGNTYIDSNYYGVMYFPTSAYDSYNGDFSEYGDEEAEAKEALEYDRNEKQLARNGSVRILCFV